MSTPLPSRFSLFSSFGFAFFSPLSKTNTDFTPTPLSLSPIFFYSPLLFSSLLSSSPISFERRSQLHYKPSVEMELRKRLNKSSSARLTSKTGSTTTTSASACASTSGSSKPNPKSNPNPNPSTSHVATTRNKLEIKIPVFSVLRNGRDYKNVVLLKVGPGGDTPESILLKVGRHPNNDICLDHPSISHHHMVIFVKPSIQKISILDLSSEQGTWVSGTKIKSNKNIEIKEGDVLRLGTSTRIYRLHWLSKSDVCETENSLPPIIEEKEEAHQEEICQGVVSDQHEITTNGVEHLQRPVRKEISDTGLDSRSVLAGTECIETIDRDAASSLLIDLVGTHQQVLPDSECNKYVMGGTHASLASDIAGTSMISETVPPASESVRSIFRATASSLICPTSEPAPPVSEPVKSISKGTPSSLLSRRSKCKPLSALSIQTGVTNVKAPQEESSSNLCEISGAKEVEVKNEEIFESDKENMTLASSHVKSNKAAHMIEISGREEVERVPFRVLFDNNVQVSSNSPLKPLDNIPDKSAACGPQQQVQPEKAREPRKEWIMVIDTGCLLGEESIKAIKLLQGLRGTRLIIPRSVIIELDCMKRHEGLFKRSNKQASLVLEWIEECMGKEPVWIHVQSSSEVPPMPPISDFRSDLNAIHTPHGTFMEMVTPSDDQVLECALVFKKLRGDAVVVLLSSSTTLKIKAKAEGLLCEEAKDFKNSLTNPFSKRFMWGNPVSGSLKAAEAKGLQLIV